MECSPAAPAPDHVPTDLTEALCAAAATGPDIAVIVPVFKQPGLLVEALMAVLEQKGGLDIRTVIVEDGCPCPETAEVAQVFAGTHAERIIHLRQANRGLSGARNAGVRWALAAWPACRAIYFLDADNRLQPDFLARCLECLESSPPDVGWIYPDIDMFGFAEGYDTSGPFSSLLLLHQNYCEAGSLVRREVFERGVAFDEAMKLGFEDWEFWIQAMAAGFKGRHAPTAGFCYRRRAESMLVDSERWRGFIVGYIRRKHQHLLQPKTLLAGEHAELPRYALHCVDRSSVTNATDPLAAARTCTKAEARADVVRALAGRGRRPHPHFLVFGSEAAINLLGRSLLRGVLWQAERLLAHCHLVGLTIGTSAEGRVALETVPRDEARREIRHASLLVIKWEVLEPCLRDSDDAWIRSLQGEPMPEVALMRALVPALEPGQGELPVEVTGSMLGEIAALRALWRNRPQPAPAWRKNARHPQTAAHHIVRTLLDCGPVFPHVPDEGELQIGFILPLVAFGGVERVVANYARACRARGHRTHLFVTDAREALLAPPFDSAFDSITFVGDAMRGGWQNERQYFGAAPSAWALHGDKRDVLGLLATMDVVLNTHGHDAHGVMAQLKRLGIRTLLGLHLVEHDALDRPMGNVHLALAYEHAYDRFVVISQDLIDWCIGQGVPGSKLVLVQNAAAYDAEPRAVARSLASKTQRQPGVPLKVLYLGRLDPQKGVDRLAGVIRACRRIDLPIEWRVVGKTVCADDVVSHEEIDDLVEPPALTPRALDRLYAWADVVLLPSRFEGVPLTILEAQRFGCVVMATAVGAVDEIVEDGRTGYLVREDGDEAVVQHFVDLLARLADSPDLVATLARTAGEEAACAGWATKLAPFFAAIDELTGRLPPLPKETLPC